MQTQPISFSPSHPIAAILMESDLQVSVASRMQIDDPAYLSTVARTQELDQQLLNTRSPDIHGVVLKIALLRKVVEGDCISDYARNLMVSTLLDLGSLAN